MKKSSMVATCILSASMLFAGLASAGDWWRTVSVTLSQSVPADHNQLCANAENQLRAQYSDVTTVQHRISFDQYGGRLYCTALGQSKR